MDTAVAADLLAVGGIETDRKSSLVVSGGTAEQKDDLVILVPDLHTQSWHTLAIVCADDRSVCVDFLACHCLSIINAFILSLDSTLDGI
jgi:hypothetical protein